MDKNAIKDLIKRQPLLASCEESISDAYLLLEECFASGHKLLIAGNGGSSSDADHIVGELMKQFKKERKLDKELAEKIKMVDKERGELVAEHLQMPLPAIALHAQGALNTAFINDVVDGGSYLFAQQVLGYGNEGDIFFAISTSGNSRNILNACVVARAKGLKIVSLTGKSGGELLKYSDVSIVVPLEETYLIQEQHLSIYHTLCLMLEDRFFKE